MDEFKLSPNHQVMIELEEFDRVQGDAKRKRGRDELDGRESYVFGPLATRPS